MPPFMPPGQAVHAAGRTETVSRPATTRTSRAEVAVQIRLLQKGLSIYQITNATLVRPSQTYKRRLSSGYTPGLLRPARGSRSTTPKRSKRPLGSYCVCVGCPSQGRSRSQTKERIESDVAGTGDGSYLFCLGLRLLVKSLRDEGVALGMSHLFVVAGACCAGACALHVARRDDAMRGGHGGHAHCIA